MRLTPLAIFLLVFCLSTSAMSQTAEERVTPSSAERSVENPSPASSRHQQSDVIESWKQPGLYVTAGFGESWESDIINFRKDETFSATFGVPITYERESVKSLQPSGTVEAGVGYNFGNNFRGEVAYVLKGHSAGSERTAGTVYYDGGSLTFEGNTEITGTLRKHALFTTLYYDLPTNSRWIPFVGAGLGVARVTSSDMRYDYDVVYSTGTRAIGSRIEPGGNNNALAYQAKLGLQYLISETTAVFLTGNYFHINRIDLGGGTIYEEFEIFGARAGVVYRW
ncbi:MAG: hypothetical protein RIS14_102 [Pseudomonadota bacterium]|jgi:opacity protein-like surface antigen